MSPSHTGFVRSSGSMRRSIRTMTTMTAAVTAMSSGMRKAGAFAIMPKATPGLRT